jgi:hypothetical protein
MAMDADEGMESVARILHGLAAQSVISTASALQMALDRGTLPLALQGKQAAIEQCIENAIMLGITVSVDKPEWAHALVSYIDVSVDDDMQTQENHRRFSEAFVDEHPVEMELPTPLAERGGDDELPDVAEILKDFSKDFAEILKDFSVEQDGGT